ncbi:TadE family type IV pilus minor pilin [Mycolicibacter acidiphilus]|uniref:TadE family type IV pilus minor pilin n=1 Tax=Mycolicibacter acidiphilus TaxID=2835306 RepID=UPI0027DE02B5|nr:TadE family type IV pilus minor pilin [Mycolicibacter acidiphilus]
MEAAFGLAALAATLVLCLAGGTALAMQVRCVDAAREAARLAARGDGPAAAAVAGRIAPAGAVLQVRRDGEFVAVQVTARTALLPGLTVAAEAVSAVEPSR